MSVCRKGVPCSEPASGTRLLFKQGDNVSASVTVAKDGTYSVSLAPGIYTVSAVAQTMVGRGVAPSTVRVAAGRARADFQIDTGIR